MTTKHQEKQLATTPPPPPLTTSLSSDGDTYDDENVFLVEQQPSVEEAVAVVEEVAEVDDDDDSSDDFEFAFAVRKPDDLPPSITADELFCGGRLLPAYPVFGRDLLSSSSDVDDPAEAERIERRISLRRLLIQEESTKRGSNSSSSEATPAAGEEMVGEYCAWAPRSAPQSPERWKKSASTGMESSWRWTLRDLVMGRSHSDGKEKFVFIGSNPPPRPASKEKSASARAQGKATSKAATEAPKAEKAGRRKSTELDMVTAHRLYYSKVNGQAAKGGRRSFLPYRQELLGLFTSVNGHNWPHNQY